MRGFRRRGSVSFLTGSVSTNGHKTRHQSEGIVPCVDGCLDVKSTEIRTANSLEIKGFREFGVIIIGLLHALFFVSERTGLLRFFGRVELTR